MAAIVPCFLPFSVPATGRNEKRPGRRLRGRVGRVQIIFIGGALFHRPAARMAADGIGYSPSVGIENELLCCSRRTLAGQVLVTVFIRV